MMFGYGMQCGTDINSVDPNTPKGTFLKLLCPKSCKACPNAQDKEEEVEYTDVEANGLTFRCRITGEDSSPNKVLFLHGFPEFAKFWFPLQNEWLATGADFHTVACDLRGYSPLASPDGIENYSYEIFAQDTWAIADQLGFKEFHLIGHDHGAGLGWLVASQPQAKSRIKSYTALSVPHVDTFSEALFGDKAVVEQQVAFQYSRNFKVADSASRGLDKMFGFPIQKPLWWYQNSRIASVPVLSDEDLVKYADNAEFSLWVRQSFKPALPVDDGAPVDPVGDIQVPVFFICGAKDPYLLCDHDYVKNQEALLKAGYRTKTYQSCEHNLFGCEDEKDSASVMSDISAFLQSQVGTACQAQKYRLVSRKFPALCLDASKLSSSTATNRALHS
jgi:pimeloyl-ACP methyl ester carboxylesterase